MQPTPPISRWMSNPTTCTMLREACEALWPRFKLWRAENCHNHTIAIWVSNHTELFVKSGDNLTTLWETVVSNENVQ